MRNSAAVLAQPATRRVLRGRVLERILRAPVEAHVATDNGTSTFSGSDGSFELDVSEVAVASIQVESPGYVSATVELDGVDVAQELEVLLDPARRACIVVAYEDGSVAADLPIVWRAAFDQPERSQISDWIDARGQVSGASVAGRTDEAGLACLATGSGALVRIEDPGTGTSKTVRVLAGQEARIVLPRAAIQLSVVDSDTRAPLPGIELDLWFPREIGAMAHTLVTGPDGRVALAPSSYPLLLRRPGADVWLSELIPLSPGMTSVGFGGRVRTMVQVETPPPDGVLTVGLRRCGGRVRFVDASNGEPISGRARVTLVDSSCPPEGEVVSRCTTNGPGAIHQAGDQLFALEDGVLSLPCGWELEAESRRSAELVFAVSGYAPIRMPRAQAPLSFDAPIAELSLWSCPSKRLRIRQSDGRAYTARVSVYSPRGDVLVWHSASPSSGLHGPFDWYGGELVVSARDAGFERRLAEQELAAASELELTIPVATGTIVVEGIPAALRSLPLSAKRGVGLEGTAYGPTAVNQGSCRFERVPAGSYLVGPTRWIVGAEMQSVSVSEDQKLAIRFNATRVDLKPDATVVVPWIGTWASGTTLRGQVRILGTHAPQPILVPHYGESSADDDPTFEGLRKVVFGRRSQQIPLDRDGRYEIAADDPLPNCIAVCIATDGPWATVQGLLVVESLMPGESIDIPMRSLELRWKGPPPSQSVSVSFEVPPRSLRYPLRTYHSKRQFSWDTTRELRIEALPTHLRQIEIQDRVLVLDDLAAGDGQIDVDFESLPSPARER